MCSSEAKLSTLNVVLLEYALAQLDIKTPCVLASQLEVECERGGPNVVFSICKCVGAKKYLSGVSGPDYLKLNRFQESGIDVEVQDFHHPTYPQLHEPFVPCMSVIDLLFNQGPKSGSVIRSARGIS